MPAQIQTQYMMDVFRNKPQPVVPPVSHQDQELTPLPELELAGLGTSPSDTMHRHNNRRQEYEAAPLPVGIEYPASPLVGRPARRNKAKEGTEATLSPLVVASGLSGLKGRLMPWRRNTAK